MSDPRHRDLNLIYHRALGFYETCKLSDYLDKDSAIGGLERELRELKQLPLGGSPEIHHRLGQLKKMYKTKILSWLREIDSEY